MPAGYMTSPVRDNLTFEVLAWTPSTKGVVRGNAVQVALPQTPTQEQMTAFSDGERSQGQRQDRAGRARRPWCPSTSAPRPCGATTNRSRNSSTPTTRMRDAADSAPAAAPLRRSPAN